MVVKNPLIRPYFFGIGAPLDSHSHPPNKNGTEQPQSFWAMNFALKHLGGRVCFCLFFLTGRSFSLDVWVKPLEALAKKQKIIFVEKPRKITWNISITCVFFCCAILVRNDMIWTWFFSMLSLGRFDGWWSWKISWKLCTQIVRMVYADQLPKISYLKMIYIYIYTYIYI